MQDFQKPSGLEDKLLNLLGIILSVGSMLVIISTLPIAQVTLVSAIALASLIITLAYVSNRLLWWMAVGAILGIIIGLAGVLATVTQTPLESDRGRLTFVAIQGTAGFIAGMLFGRKVPQPHLPTLKDFISSFSGLTVAVFAVIVTLRFIIEGFAPAQQLSSRLGLATTIEITLVVIPGYIGYLLVERLRVAMARQ